MDKYEYKVRADEIKALIAEGEYAEAVKIADTVDWRRVRGVSMLCTISDLYKINRRYQESKDILLLAYEKQPNRRPIVYSLCELSIKMEEYVQAIEYYKEYVQIAPRDSGRYILQYRLYEAQDVSLEERIAVLEEFKKRDYREKWAYELAYLYHRIGLATKCVEECDEMFLWFGEGKYVIKALELKALHEPLTEEQQAKYDYWMQGKDGEDAEEEPEEQPEYGPEQEEENYIGSVPEDTKIADDIRHTAGYAAEEEQPIAEVPTTELPEVRPVDVGQYNTINLQRELAESMKELLDGEEEQAQSIAEAIIAPLLQETMKLPGAAAAQEQPEQEEKPQKEAVKQTPEAPAKESGEAAVSTKKQDAVQPDTDELPELGAQSAKEDMASLDAQQIMSQMKEETVHAKLADTGKLTPLNTKPSDFDRILSQEYDGQISLVVPDAEHVEKQITGQLSISDIMAEWEQTKKTTEEKRMEEVRQRILAQTGSLFANFDDATKNGLLEEMERAFRAALMKGMDKPPIKEVILPEDVDDNLQSVKKKEVKPAVKQEVKQPEPIAEEDGVEELEEIEETEAAEGSEESPASQTVQAEEETAKDSSEQKESSEPQAYSGRELTEEEREIFGQYVHQRRSRQQLVNVLDNMSLASYTGNVIITGEEEDTTLGLAKGLIREMQEGDSNFSGKIAKIAGAVLNKKDVSETFARLDNGALIIEKASDLKPQTVAKMSKVLDQYNKGLLLLMTDTKQKMNKFFEENESLKNNFNLRIDIEPLNDEALVAYAKQYAEEMEYSIDEFGILALHTRIADRQTSDHEVSLAEIRELVDEAIYYANKKTPKHFMDILLAKRYDEEDMIVLREKDFMHN